MERDMKMVSAYFVDLETIDRGQQCREIFRRFGGVNGGSGTFILTGERDMQYDIPEDKVEPLEKALLDAGFYLTPQK